MSAYAKSIVGAVAAVLITGITAWQSATSDGFRLVDLLPIGIAVAGALLTYVVPNVPELPAAKAWVAGTLAVLTALSTGLTGLSPKADAVQVVFALAGAFLSWYVPNIPGQRLVAPIPPAPAVPDVAASAFPDLPPAADADPPTMPTTTEPAGPLPIEAEARQAAAEQSAAADAPTTEIPAVDPPPRPAVV